MSYYTQLAVGVMVLYGAVFLLRYVPSWRQDRNLAKLHGCEAPPRYRHKDPIFGLDGLFANLRAIKQGRYLERQREVYVEYGLTFESIMNGGRVINTIDPINIQAVFSDRFEDYGVGAKRRAAFAPLLDEYHSVFQLDGPDWHRSRRSLNRFLGVRPEQLVRIFEPHYQGLIAGLPGLSNGCIAADLGPTLHRYTFDIATHWLFGASSNLLTNHSHLDEEFFGALHRAQHGCEVRWQAGPFASYVQGKTFDQDIATVKEYVAQKVPLDAAQRLYNGKESPIHSMEDEDYVSRLAIHPQLLTLLIAASDTSAATLTSCLHALARHPDVWAKLRNCVHEVTGDSLDPPDCAQLQQMTYLQWCAYETLRLWPVQPHNSRIAERHTVLPTGGGPNGRSPLLLRRGDMVGVGLSTLYRRTDIWGDDAADFKPARWAGITDNKIRWAFMPFSRGPRKCPGQNIATLKVTYTLARLAQNFVRIESVDGRPWVEKLALACTSKEGAKVKLYPNKGSHGKGG